MSHEFQLQHPIMRTIGWIICTAKTNDMHTIVIVYCPLKDGRYIASAAPLIRVIIAYGSCGSAVICEKAYILCIPEQASQLLSSCKCFSPWGWWNLRKIRVQGPPLKLELHVCMSGGWDKKKMTYVLVINTWNVEIAVDERGECFISHLWDNYNYYIAI